MTSVRVALLQMTAAGNDQAANLEEGAASCRSAAGLGANIALFRRGGRSVTRRPLPATPPIFGALALWHAHRSAGTDTTSQTDPWQGLAMSAKREKTKMSLSRPSTWRRCATFASGRSGGTPSGTRTATVF